MMSSGRKVQYHSSQFGVNGCERVCVLGGCLSAGVSESVLGHTAKPRPSD